MSLLPRLFAPLLAVAVVLINMDSAEAQTKRVAVTRAIFLSTSAVGMNALVCSPGRSTPGIGIVKSQNASHVSYRIFDPSKSSDRKRLRRAIRECKSLRKNPACSDRTDNDADGLRDFPLDPGCASGSDASEEDPPTSDSPFAVFRKPFDGDFSLSSLFDHQFPQQFEHADGVTISSYDEQTTIGVDGHEGYDFAMPVGTPLLASYDGVVELAGPESPFFCPLLNETVSGNKVVIRHTVASEEFVSVYAHLSTVALTVGQTVARGQAIGLSGNTGCSTGPHLHFNIVRVTNTNGAEPASIDPYGWNSATVDPWSVHAEGTQSFSLWTPGEAPQQARFVVLAANPNEGDNSPVAITTLQYAGPLDDQNPNNEFVELNIDTRFSSGSSYSLSGFTLRNNAGERFSFPSGFSIRSGDPVRVYSGSGTNSGTRLYWNRGSGAWNNSGDCAALVRSNNNRMYRLSYGNQGCSATAAAGGRATSGVEVRSSELNDMQPKESLK